MQYNTIKNSFNVNDNHDDGIQAWTTGTGGVGTGVIRGNVLQGNVIINRENPNQRFPGELQGIGLFDGTYRDWVIVNNVVVVDHPHGIALYGAVDCQVVNNAVVDLNPTRRSSLRWERRNGRTRFGTAPSRIWGAPGITFRDLPGRQIPRPHEPATRGHAKSQMAVWSAPGASEAW